MATSKPDDITSDGEQLIGTTECVWNIDLVCVDKEESLNTLSSVLKYKWKNNNLLEGHSGNKEDQLKHTQLVIYIQNPQAARKDRLIASSYNQLLDHVVHLRMPAESMAFSFSAFCKQVLFNKQMFAFSLLQCMQPYVILLYVVVKSLQAHNNHILGCLLNIS